MITKEMIRASIVTTHYSTRMSDDETVLMVKCYGPEGDIYYEASKIGDLPEETIIDLVCQERADFFNDVLSYCTWLEEFTAKG